MINNKKYNIRLISVILFTILPGILALAAQFLPHIETILTKWIYISIIFPVMILIYDMLATLKTEYNKHLTSKTLISKTLNH